VGIAVQARFVGPDCKGVKHYLTVHRLTKFLAAESFAGLVWILFASQERDNLRMNEGLKIGINASGFANQYGAKVIDNYLIVLSGESLGSVGGGPGVIHSDLTRFLEF